jgi:hypothetical protein
MHEVFESTQGEMAQESAAPAVSSEDRSLWRLLQTRIRRRRFGFVKSLFSALLRPLRLLDVGGTQEYWEKMQFISDDVEIVLLNVSRITTSYPSLVSMVGDAREMREFKDKEFAVVFSNSVIEHVGSYEEQRRMAAEVRRIGERYCVQTPNRYFPIEPHVLLPFFQFLPFSVRIFILAHFRTPWGWKLKDEQEAVEYVRGIRLLNEREMRELFPGAKIYKEKFLGLTKSLIAYEGW